MKKITVVIPTCDRAKTLYYSLKTCLNQTYPNYEIIVSNNASIDNTEEVVKSFNDTRIKYIKTKSKLSMTEHWEFALNHVDEGYVSIIGDDDGLLPNAVDKMGEMLNKHNISAIASIPLVYVWAESYNLIEENFEYSFLNSKEILDKLSKSFDYYPEFTLTPTIYRGLVSLEVIKRIKYRDNLFFNSPIPDIYSNIIILSEIENYLFSKTPFFIIGTSKYSTGTSFSKDKKSYFNKSIINNFYGNSKPLNIHPKLGTGTYNFKINIDSITFSEAFLQAREKNNRVPEIRIEDLLDKIINYNIFQEQYTKEQELLVLDIAKNIAKINNLENFYFEKLKKRNKIKKNNLVLEQLLSKSKITFFPDSSIKDINSFSLKLSDYSKDCYEKLSYKPYNIELKNESENTFVLNFSINDEHLNTIETNKIKIFLPNNKQIKVIYDFDLPQNITEKYYLISRPIKIEKLSIENIDLINNNIDQIWVYDEKDKNNLINQKITSNKIFVIPKIVENNIQEVFTLIEQQFKFLTELPIRYKKPDLRELKLEAILQFENKNFSLAKELYQKLFSIDSNNQAFNFNIGLCLFFEEKYSEALQVFSTCLKNGYINKEVYQYLHEALLKIGDEKTASIIKLKFLT